MTVVPSLTKNSSSSQLEYANGVTLNSPGSATLCVAPPWVREIYFKLCSPTGFHNITNPLVENRFVVTVLVRPLQGRAAWGIHQPRVALR